MRIPLILTLCLFLISSLYAQQRDLFASEFFENQEFAHRGGYAFGPENAMETILKSISSGHTAIEVDIQITHDGHLVLFHDKTISRLLAGNLDVKVSDLTSEELRKIPYAADSDVFVPTFKTLLDTIGLLITSGRSSDLLVELDFKLHEASQLKAGVDELLKLISDKQKEVGDEIYNHLFVSSFYPFVLKSIREQNRKIKTAFAVNSNPDYSKLKGKAGVFFAKMVLSKYEVQILEPNLCLVNERFVKKWHKRGILINSYTANTQCQKEHLRNLQVALTTNCPYTICEGTKSDQVSNNKKWCKRCAN